MRTWSAQNPLEDGPPDAAAQSDGRASWYAQGGSDALGDRLLMFDNSGGPSLELLRFSWKLVAVPGFEEALRERVELLSQFRHPSFAKVRAVERLEPKNDLTLVSNHVSGKPLAEELAALRGPAFAMWVVRELVPALAILHQHAPGVAHGALTAERIVMTPEGRLVILEHVLGSALERLQLSPTELWMRFGIPTAHAQEPVTRLDCATDVFQLALVALSVLLGRSIAKHEYPKHFEGLLAEFPQTSGRELPASLRMWLLRALRLEGRPFESASDAQHGFGELEGAGPASLLPALEAEAQPTPVARPLRTLPERDPVRSLSRPAEGSPDGTRHAEPFQPAPPFQPPALASSVPSAPLASSVVPPVLSVPVASSVPSVPPAPLAAGSHSQRPVVAADLLNEHRSDLGLRYGRPEARWRGWALAGVTVLAVGQAGYIGYLLSSQPAAVTIQIPQPPASRNPGGFSALPATSPPSQALAPDSQPAAGVIGNTPVRSGGLRLISRIEMQLLDGERVLGSTTEGPIVTSAGRHEFELVNSALGYRARQVFNVKPGEIVSVAIPQPEGKMSINAVPWAEVWIDGVHIGETPLANLSIPIGQHEVSFRHPSLAEQRRTTIVRYDVPTRLSADLR